MKRTPTSILSTQGQQRRQLGRVALGAAAALGLAACGGGGGGDESISLQEAYDRLRAGMTKKQVRDLVGRTASTTSNTDDFYADGSQKLHVGFSADAAKISDDFLISSANLYGGGSDISKLF